MDISVIVPVYNEEELIAGTLREIDSFLKSSGWEFEIIVVDDGSIDKSKETVKTLNNSKIKLLEHQRNFGKGRAVKSGMLASSGDFLLFMDADNSTTIDNLEHFLNQLKSNEADIVIASRDVPGAVIRSHQSLVKERSGKFGNLLVRSLLLSDFKDTQCGFKLFKRECLKIFKKQTVDGWGFDFEILFLAKRYNFSVLELPVVWTNNPDSKVKTFDYLATLLELFKVKFNNLMRRYED